MTECVLAIDLGAGGPKVALVAADERALDRHRALHAAFRTTPSR